MKFFDDWRLVSNDQLGVALPEVLSLMEAHLNDCDAGARERIQQAINSLKANPPRADELRRGQRQAELRDLADAFASVAKHLSAKGDANQALSFLNVAHELARGRISDSKPTGHMRKIISEALRMIVRRDFPA